MHKDQEQKNHSFAVCCVFNGISIQILIKRKYDAKGSATLCINTRPEEVRVTCGECCVGMLYVVKTCENKILKFLLPFVAIKSSETWDCDGLCTFGKSKLR